MLLPGLTPPLQHCSWQHTPQKVLQEPSGKPAGGSHVSRTPGLDTCNNSDDSNSCTPPIHRVFHKTLPKSTMGSIRVQVNWSLSDWYSGHLVHKSTDTLDM
ncbi:hypothetical protein E2C01_097732 [Portunus trituberculatus]|uniref:Uncharacterized protein n=1 Tax=Portunus trituberculatus TaxID=210409 RepID=A0A5B7JVZ4_PORTR|nr:hypothetical protein [Portunus trituberculatus]